MVTQFSAFSARVFYCNFCDIKCSRKNDFDRHLLTIKHSDNTLGYKKSAKKVFICDVCNKNYKSRYGLWKHNKKCMPKIENTMSNTVSNTENNKSLVDSSLNEIRLLTGLVVELVKSNNDLQKQVLEICKNNSNNTSTNTNNIKTNIINSHNKTFNLQIFLNEECKDAMNLSEFINSIQPKISDLENIGKVGYVEGISNIIIKQLNETQINKRPVHCSDAKRETLYVKDEDKWEKDTEETKKMVKAVRDVNKKNYQLLSNWKDMYPNCTDSKSNQSEDFTKIVGEVVMDSDVTNVKKVIKKVAKQVIIGKQA